MQLLYVFCNICYNLIQPIHHKNKDIFSKRQERTNDISDEMGCLIECNVHFHP